MSLFDFFSKKLRSSQQKRLKTFILEPILTPSGLVDGGEDTPDLVDLDLNDVDDLFFDEEESLPAADSGEETGDDSLEVLDFFDPEDELALVEPETAFTSGYFTVGEEGVVSIDFLFDGGGYKGELAIFSLEGMEEFEPGSEEFITEAASRSLSNSELGHVVISDADEGAKFSGELGEGDRNSGEYLGQKSFAMKPGEKFGFMLVPNGQVEEVLDNPNVGGKLRPLFSLATANPEDAFHVGQIADVTGNGNTFVMEDLRVDTGSDYDYNDLIFQVSGAKGDAVLLDEVIDPDLDWRDTDLGQEIVSYGVPQLNNTIADLTLSLEEPNFSVDLSTIFSDPQGQPLNYEVLEGSSESIVVSLEGSELTVTVQPNSPTEVNEVAVRATDPDGNYVIHTWQVTVNQLDPESISNLETSLGEIEQIIAEIDTETLTEEVVITEFDEAIATLEEVLEQNPELVEFIAEPQSLSQLGISDESIATVEQLLHSQKVGEMLGLPVDLTSALNDSQGFVWDNYLINADEAAELLPDEAESPPVAFLDFTGEHSENVTQAFTSVNGIAEYEVLPIGQNNWAAELIKFVEQLKARGETGGIANLSFDLAQVDEIGQTTRYAITPEEQIALNYARENNVLLVVASGNTGDRMSALGAAAEDFDNIITVGAVNSWEEVTAYSSRGEGLTLVAPGGEYQNDPDAFVGTSRASAYVTGAASLVWATNPELSYLQVKEILTSTATDLGPDGWDVDSGAGLLDVTEALLLARSIDPQTVQGEDFPPNYQPFLGKGRVQLVERAATAATEAAVTQLGENQNNLIDQWTVLWLLGNPELTLDDLKTEVETKTATALDTYQNLSTQAAVTTAQAEQLATALSLATSHNQIEQTRLQTVLSKQQELVSLLQRLEQEKAALEQSTQQQKQQIEANIAETKQAIAVAVEKLDYLLIDPQTLVKDVASLRYAAVEQKRLAQNYRNSALTYEEAEANHLALAEQYEQQSRTWQVVGYEKSRSGRRKKEKWGWVTDPEKIKLRDQQQWQADIAGENAQILRELAQQLEEQAKSLESYADGAEELNNTTGDAAAILTLLQQQLASKEQLAANYLQQSELAEKRRQQNLEQAKWHDSQIRIQRVKKKSSGRKTTYEEYNPEHIPARDQAQQEAEIAAQEIPLFQQLAQQAEQEAELLRKQVKALKLRVEEDWPRIKQGIEYEITAQRQRLQAQEDLLLTSSLDNQQQLEKLQLQIEQKTAELQQLAAEKLPTQQQTAEATQQRLEENQAEWQEFQKTQQEAQQKLQEFLETSGYFLPYQERTKVVEEISSRLQGEQARVAGIVTQLEQQLAQDNDNIFLKAQLEQMKSYLNNLEQELTWANVQQDSFNLAAPDSPARLDLTSLVTALQEREVANPATNTLPLSQYIDFLQGIEVNSSNLLTGFDSLSDRLNSSQAEKTTVENTLVRLEEEYRQLGLQKAGIEALSFVPDVVAATKTEVQQKQSLLADYQQQIGELNAVAEDFEQQRLDYEAEAEEWDNKIYTTEIIGYRNSSSKLGGRKPIYGEVYHPEAEANRDFALAAAAEAKEQRDATIVQRKEVEANLPIVKEEIAQLKRKIATLNQAQQKGATTNLATQITDKQNEIQITTNRLQQLQDTVANLTNTLKETEQNKLDRQTEIVATEGAIANAQAEIASLTEEIARQEEVLELEAQKETALTEADWYEEQAALHWEKSRKDGPTWTEERVTYEEDWKGRKRKKVVTITHTDHDWVTWDEYTKKAAELRQGAIDTQGEIDQLTTTDSVSEAQVITLKAEQESWQEQETQLNADLQTQQQELQALNQQIVALGDDIPQKQEQVLKLQAKLETQEEEKEILISLRSPQQNLLAEIEPKLRDKYQEIDLAEQYQQQVEADVVRLESRLALLNRADELETQFQQQQQQWQNTAQKQSDTVTALITTREQSKADREQLLNLRSQLNQVNTNLQQVEAAKVEVEQVLQQQQEALALTDLQLGNQQIQLQSLEEQDAPLLSAEQYFLNLAEQERQQIWYWEKGEWKYNEEKAQAYRKALQNASLAADTRNQLWPPIQETRERIEELEIQQTEQKEAIATSEAELAVLEPQIPPLETQVTNLETEIAPIAARIAPLEALEEQQVEEFKTAVGATQTLASNLEQTTQEQVQALRRLISFGILAAESDLDFFPLEVAPKVEVFLQQLQQRSLDFSQQSEQLEQLIANWQQDLAVVGDDLSRQAITAQITQSQNQLTNLQNWKAENDAAITELEDYLHQANQTLEDLRLKQEAEVREALINNEKRLQSLQSQLQSENAAESALAEDSILAYTQLGNSIRQDLQTIATTWTEDWQAGHNKTKELGQQQQSLSQEVDQLIDSIKADFATPHSEYNRQETKLAEAIAILGVAAPKQDNFAETVTDQEQAIAQLKQRINQDEILWQAIEPLANRFGIELEQLKPHLLKYEAIQNFTNPKVAHIPGLREEAAELENEAEEITQANPNLTKLAELKERLEELEKEWVDTFKQLWEPNQNTIPKSEVVLSILIQLPEHTYYNSRVNRFYDPYQDNFYTYTNGKISTLDTDSSSFDDQNHLDFKISSLHQEIEKLEPKATEVEELKEQASEIKEKADKEFNQVLSDSRAAFLGKYPNNATAIDVLEAETAFGRNKYQGNFETAKAQQAENAAAAAAALSQADWYEQEAAYHLEISQRLGPDKQQATWTEERVTWKRNWKGKKKRHVVTVTHVNHDWIIWDNYTKLAAELRQQGVDLLKEVQEEREAKERWEPLATSWTDANNAANQATPTIKEARNLIEQLEVARESLPEEKAQLSLFEQLLPTLRQQLNQAQQQADAANAQALQGWTEYDPAATEYQDEIAAILTKRGELNRESQATQNELAEVEKWVEQQSVALGTEIAQVEELRKLFQNRNREIEAEITNLVTQGVVVDVIDELRTKQAQLQKSAQLLENKAAVLTNQQTALTQKRILLTAQNEVIVAEQHLLDAYLNSPDELTALQQQLEDAREALAEAQRLAEEAEATSQALTAPLRELQSNLLSQNDEHLQAAREKQNVLKDLLQATQLNANYTLEAAQKQQLLNDLELQILQRLQAATLAGNEEAQRLLDVARYTNMAAAAEIYYQDYRDLATDKRTRCAGGIGTAEDRRLADKYYQEWLENEELKKRSQEQAANFTEARETAEEQMAELQTQQVDAATELQQLNEQIATTDEEIEAKQRDLGILEARVEGLERIREQTEQTFIQLLTLEQLNLAQAKLEQQFAAQRQEDIEEAVQNRLERDRLEIERQRKEAEAKIEQLRQLQAEDNLRQALNQVRSDVGLATVDGTVDTAQLQVQLAGLLTGLQSLQGQQAKLPDDLQALLTEVEGDILLALRGDEAKKIEENLLLVAEGLIEQIQQYRAEISQIELEEQQDKALLQQAEQNIQAATLQLLQEIEESNTLGAERELLTPLNLEVLQKVAYAEQAVDISEELAKNSKELLQDILKKRKEERKQRKNAFWTELLGTIALVYDVIGTILSFIPPLKPIAIAFKVAAGIYRGIAAAINGDWSGAIYQIAKSVIEAAGVPTQYKTLLDTAYQAYRASEAGDDALAFLYVIQGLANVAAGGIDASTAFSEKLLITVGQISATGYQGIQAIENGDWEGAFGSIAGMVGTIGTNFAGELESFAQDILGEETAKGLFGDEGGGLFEVFGQEIGFDELQKIYKTTSVVVGAVDEGGVDAWLAGINNVLGIWEDEIQDAVNEFFFEPDVIEMAKKLGVDPENVEKQEEDGKIKYTATRKDGSVVSILIDKKDSSFGDGETDSLDSAPTPPLEPFPKQDTSADSISSGQQITPEAKQKAEKISKLDINEWEEAVDSLPDGDFKEQVYRELQILALTSGSSNSELYKGQEFQLAYSTFGPPVILFVDPDNHEVLDIEETSILGGIQKLVEGYFNGDIQKIIDKAFENETTDPLAHERAAYEFGRYIGNSYVVGIARSATEIGQIFKYTLEPIILDVEREYWPFPLSWNLPGGGEDALGDIEIGIKAAANPDATFEEIINELRFKTDGVAGRKPPKPSD